MYGTVPPPKMIESQIESHLMEVVMAQQYSIKKTKEVFGDKTNAAVLRELTQINNFETYVLIKARDLSWEEKKKALESLIFVTEKIKGDIKARKGANGSKQRTYDGYNTSDCLLLTAVTERIFMTGVIDWKEETEVAVLNIANTSS